MITTAVADRLLDFAAVGFLLLSIVFLMHGVLRIRYCGWEGLSLVLIAAGFGHGVAALAILYRDWWWPALVHGHSSGPQAGPGVWDWFREATVEWWPVVWPSLVKGLFTVLVLSGAVVVCRLLARLMIGALRSCTRRRSAQRAHTAASQRRLTACLERWETLRDAYGTLLMDPVRSLELQALFNLQVGQSRAFHRAWTAFDDLARQLQNENSATVAEEVLDRLETRAGDTENLWVAVQRHAERIGWTNLAAADQPRAARALGLLKTAHSTTASTGERDNAWALAAKILAALNLAHLPEPAVAAVTAHARPALTQGAGS